MPFERIEILLVEDNPADARLVQAMLKQAPGDWSLIVTHRVFEALRILRNNSFHAVLLDLTLPDSAGLETVERLIVAARGTPVVVLTNENDPRIAQGAAEWGVAGWLSKGNVNAGSLVGTLRPLIDRAAA